MEAEEHNPYEAPETREFADPGGHRRRYEGIGGWLILVAVGVVLTPLLNFGSLLIEYLPLLVSGQIGEFMSPEHPSYHPLLAPLIIVEAIMLLGFGTWSVVNLVCFFRKKAVLPRLMVWYLSACLLWVFLDNMVAVKIPAVSANISDSQVAGDVLRSMVAAGIWIPYFLVSKRVKATFVR